MSEESLARPRWVFFLIARLMRVLWLLIGRFILKERVNSECFIKITCMVVTFSQTTTAVENKKLRKWSRIRSGWHVVPRMVGGQNPPKKHYTNITSIPMDDYFQSPKDVRKLRRTKTHLQ